MSDVCVPHVFSTHGGQKRAPETEVTKQSGCWELKPSPGRTAVLVTVEPLLQSSDILLKTASVLVVLRTIVAVSLDDYR